MSSIKNAAPSENAERAERVNCSERAEQAERAEHLSESTMRPPVPIRKRGGKSADLSGLTFGHLSVVAPTDERKNGYIVYKCACTCGRPGCKHIVYRSSRSLKNSVSPPDCECEKKRKPFLVDLTGRRFGMLTVLYEVTDPSLKIKNHVSWNCLCDCGNAVITTSAQLVTGNRISCGCQQRGVFRIRDLQGRQYGHLTVISYEKYENGIHYWRCLCSCGNEKVARQSDLLNGHIHSCGCQMLSALDECNRRYNYDGTRILSIRGKAGERKASRASKSGVRGVYPTKYGKWYAQITFKGKVYHLGSFDTIHEARQARERAEEEMFDKTIQEWEALQEENKKKKDH